MLISLCTSFKRNPFIPTSPKHFYSTTGVEESAVVVATLVSSILPQFYFLYQNSMCGGLHIFR